MKLKLVVVDLELSLRQKYIGAGATAVASLVVGASVATADVPHTFVAGDTLTAVALTENFASIDDRLDALTTETTALSGLITAGEESVIALEARVAALEAEPAPLTLGFQDVPAGSAYYTECINTSGTFAPGACARMATYYCQAQGFESGWLDGDVGVNSVLGVMCIK